MYKIAVLGCGCIGLSTALELQKTLQEKAEVTIIADKFTPNTTSDIAAGFWEPYLVQDNNPDDISRWSKCTYEYLLKLWQQGHAKQMGICLQTAINLVDTEDFILPKWLENTLGYNQLSAEYLRQLSELYGRRFTAGYAFITFTWEAVKFLEVFEIEFLSNGGKIINKHLNSLEELNTFDIIVNCTGFGARELCQDLLVKPVRGQTRRVKSPAQYCIYVVDLNEEESCYIIPNTDSVVLGGTKQISFDTKINESDKKRFLSNIFKLNPSLQNAELVNDIVGLRPSRFQIRLEQELKQTNNGTIMKIVHNYGHSGSGITLCIGCAKDAVKLVENLLQFPKKNKL